MGSCPVTRLSLSCSLLRTVVQLPAVDVDVLSANAFQLEKEKHLKRYYACSGPRRAPVAKPRCVSATVRLPPAQETDCLSLHDFASSPDDDNNSHSSEWRQTEGVRCSLRPPWGQAAGGEGGGGAELLRGKKGTRLEGGRDNSAHCLRLHRTFAFQKRRGRVAAAIPPPPPGTRTGPWRVTECQQAPGP
ncbi:hypothetical protein MHYP_G00359200 [Metynnis hypsauchen]